MFLVDLNLGFSYYNKNKPFTFLCAVSTYHSDEHFMSNKNQNSQRMTQIYRKIKLRIGMEPRGSCTGIVKTLKQTALAQKWIWLAFLMAAHFILQKDCCGGFPKISSLISMSSYHLMYVYMCVVLCVHNEKLNQHNDTRVFSGKNSLEVCFPRCSTLNLLEFYFCHRKSNKILFRCGYNFSYFFFFVHVVGAVRWYSYGWRLGVLWFSLYNIK